MEYELFRTDTLEYSTEKLQKTGIFSLLYAVDENTVRIGGFAGSKRM